MNEKTIEADIIFDLDCDFISEAEINETLAILFENLSDEIPETVSELSLLLTTDQAIQVLNKNYRNKDKPTDVLSFPLLEGEGSEFSISLGDLVISLETCKRQAIELELSDKERFLQLLVHGLLHLLGYDHENVPESERIRMEEREDCLLCILSSSNL